MFGKQKQVDICEFKDNQDYIVRFCLRKQKHKGKCCVWGWQYSSGVQCLPGLLLRGLEYNSPLDNLSIIRTERLGRGSVLEHLNLESSSLGIEVWLLGSEPA